MPTHPRLRIDSETGERNDFGFRASGPIQNTDEDRANVEGHEVQGAVGPHSDTIEFSGIPLDFDASDPWELNLALDMGAGWVEVVPPYLNAATFDIRSEGAHYMLSVAEPGMIIRAGKADPRDGVFTEDNTLAAGNVAEGGVDSWKIWPFCRIDPVADHPAEARFRGSAAGWQDVPVFAPEMGF